MINSEHPVLSLEISDFIDFLFDCTLVGKIGFHQRMEINGCNFDLGLLLDPLLREIRIEFFEVLFLGV